MKNICFYFQVHQPYRMRKYPVFDVGKNHQYYDNLKNRQIMQKVAKKCYIPTNNIILRLINKTKGKFKVAYSITGIALEQFEKYAPDVLESFKELAGTGCVEFLSETYYHSLAYLYSKEEFTKQVNKHKNLIKKLFGQNPKVFRNTELIYYNELAKFVEDMGYKAIIAEGADHILKWRSPNHVYRPKTTKKIKLLLKNYKLSDDIAFRFSNRKWKEYPLTTEKFVDWAAFAQGETINLFMDYETFGEHQWEDTGIFNFLNSLPKAVLKKNMGFILPSQAADLTPVGELDVHHAVSWADVERDLSAWLGNKMQQTALDEIYKIEKEIINSDNNDLLRDWRLLQTSDHFYYMCTKWFADGDVHKYFNPYDSPYDSYISFMNVLNDLIYRIKGSKGKHIVTEKPSILIKK
ncbi:polysaccharide deacetylase family protein [Candidatus Woesearchaeota archaeon]|nr:polysaccharide deacetylase family protein [Candidatus Woesearchaeota archaeon]